MIESSLNIEISIANSVSQLLTQSYNPVNIKSPILDKINKELEEIKNKEEIKV